MRSQHTLSVHLSVFPLITFEPNRRLLLNLAGTLCHYRWVRRRIFEPVASTMPKWETFKLLRWMQKLRQSTKDNEMLHADRS